MPSKAPIYRRLSFQCAYETFSAHGTTATSMYNGHSTLQSLVITRVSKKLNGGRRSSKGTRR